MPYYPPGDVVGPAGATDNAIARFDTATGKLIQNSVVTVGDTGAIAGAASLAIGVALTAGQVLTGAGNASLSGYLRVGSNTAPANTTAGDLTAVRLSLGNNALGSTTGSVIRASGTLTDTSGTVAALYSRATFTPGSASTATVRSLWFETVTTGANSVNLIESGFFQNIFLATGNATTIGAIFATGFVQDAFASNFGTVSTVDAINVTPIFSSSNSVTGTITVARGLTVTNSTLNSQTLTGQAGVAVANLTAGVNNTHILIGTTTPPSGNWGIYNSSTNPSYHAGFLTLGSTTATNARLQVVSAAGDNVPAVLINGGGDASGEHVGKFLASGASFAADVVRVAANRSASTAYNLINAILDEDGTPTTAYTLRGDAIWQYAVPAAGTPDLAVNSYNAGSVTAYAGARYTFASTGGQSLTTTTSSTSITFGTGSQAFTVSAGLSNWNTGDTVMITSAGSAATDYMYGTITSYVTTTLTINVTASVGSGAHTDWTIQVLKELAALSIVNTGTGMQIGAPAATNYALILANQKPDLTKEGQVGGLLVTARGGYNSATPSRDYSAAGFQMNDMSLIQGNIVMQNDKTSSVSSYEVSTYFTESGTVKLQTKCSEGLMLYNGINDGLFTPRVIGFLSQLLSSDTNPGGTITGIGFYASGSYTYAMATTNGAVFDMDLNRSVPSDPRLKTEIEPLTDCLAAVRNIGVYSFMKKGNSNRQLGFIATSEYGHRGVLEAFDEHDIPVQAATLGEDGYYRLGDTAMTAIHWKATQELADIASNHEDRISRLEKIAA